MSDTKRKCGWCITGDCDRCRPVIIYEDKEYKCECNHANRMITLAEWLGYEKWDRDEKGRPE